MPNAQTHLANVYPLMNHSALADDAARSAFLLGAISPDVRAISGQEREETHFFYIPPRGAQPAHDAMLARYPALNDARTLPAPHAVFVAGYITHLVMDETWSEMVVMPGLFIAGMEWGVRHPNWWVYSLLMTYLEYRAVDQLPGDAVGLLASAEPDRWLPFVSDKHLRQWRDHVVRMIRKGGARHISRMFALTNKIGPKKLEQIVLDEARMDEEAFQTVPREQLIAFEKTARQRSQQAIREYLD